MKKVIYIFALIFSLFILSSCSPSIIENPDDPDIQNPDDPDVENPDDPDIENPDNPDVENPDDPDVENPDDPEEPPVDEEKDPSEMTDEEFEEYITKLENKELETMEEIINSLNELIPDETITNISLPNRVGDNNILIIWNVSNSSAISLTGIIARKTYDQTVTLTATLKGSYVNKTFTKDVTIMKIVIKTLDKDRLTFAYLYSDTFSSFLEGDLDKIDVINLCFAGIANGKLYLNSVKKLNEIMAARGHGVRVVLSIGGWGADGFSDACLNSASRKAFIDSIMDAIKEYEFDGIDFDWEYPAVSAAGIKSRPEDKANFTLLCQELRDAFNEYNPDLLLTAAVPGGSPSLYEVSKLNQCLSYLHLMTYDLSKSGITSHHSALYKSSNTIASADEAVKLYSNAGFEKARMTIGLAFYGYKSTVSDPSTTSDGMNVNNTTPRGTISYTNIVNTILSSGNFIEYYDETAMAYWLYDGTTFVSYENTKSIDYKCDYAKTQGLAGVMFWDYNNDKTGTLLNAIYDNFKE
ncbi:MAG: glycosyl hydrolase family 18 protein [Bacilli bacterium]|nr:glycosyl hydrolase family 18 protein [Bacilli bacterium]